MDQPGFQLLFFYSTLEHGPTMRSERAEIDALAVMVVLILQIYIKQQLQKLLGAAEARRAHNPEDLGSKPRAATYCACLFYFC